MTSNLLIGYSEVQLNSSSVAFVSTYGDNDPDHPLTNIAGGSRYDYVKSLYAVDPIIIRWDMGVGGIASTEFLFVAGAILAKKQGAEMMKLQMYDGATEYEVVGTDSDVQTLTYSGPRGEDLMFTNTFNTKAGSAPSDYYRYAQLVIGIDGGTFTKFMFRKAMCGLFFDMGREPVVPIEQELKLVKSTSRVQQYNVKLTWEGVTDAKRNDLFDKILKHRDISPVVLYDTGNLFLDDFYTLHCKVKDYTITPKLGHINTIEIEFEELI